MFYRMVLPEAQSSPNDKRIMVNRDLETGQWWAESDDIPGLVSESDTIEGLHDRVAAVLPDLLREIGFSGSDVRLEFITALQVLVA